MTISTTNWWKVWWIASGLYYAGRAINYVVKTEAAEHHNQRNRYSVHNLRLDYQPTREEHAEFVAHQRLQMALDYMPTAEEAAALRATLSQQDGPSRPGLHHLSMCMHPTPATRADHLKKTCGMSVNETLAYVRQHYGKP